MSRRILGSDIPRTADRDHSAKEGKEIRSVVEESEKAVTMSLGDLLKDLYSKSVNDGDIMPSTEQPYPTIHFNDRQPVSVIEPDLSEGPWIAGGAALKWFQQQPVMDSDIDIFCRSRSQAQAVIDRIKGYNRYQIKHESDNAVTISYHDKDQWSSSWNLQVITKNFYPDIESVINQFDITVCQIGTTGTEWVLGRNTARDIRTRTLAFTERRGPDSVKRLVKYWIYGFRPEPATLDSLINDPDLRWDFASDGDPYSGI